MEKPENKELDITPTKLQCYIPAWRKTAAENLAEQYGTTLTQLVSEGLDLVMERKKALLPANEKAS